MQAIICEICGSNELVKVGNVFVCEYCKTKYDPEAAKNLYKNNVRVLIDESTKAENLIKLAFEEYNLGNYPTAGELVNEALELDAEAAAAWELRWLLSLIEFQNEVEALLATPVVSSGETAAGEVIGLTNPLEDEVNQTLHLAGNASTYRDESEQEAWLARRSDIYTNLIFKILQLIAATLEWWVQAEVNPRMASKYRVSRRGGMQIGPAAETVALGEQTKRLALIISAIIQSVLRFRDTIPNGHLDAQGKREQMLALYDSLAPYEHAIEQFFLRQLRGRKTFNFYDPKGPVRQRLWSSVRV